MKKFFRLICLLLVLPLILCACGEDEPTRRYDYDLSEYVELKQLKKVKAPFADPSVCTEEEVDYAVHQIMLSYAEYTPKEEGSTVGQYDKAVVDYKILYEGEELSEYSQPEYGIVIGYDGNGDIDEALSKELFGKKVGDYCKIKYTFPTDDVSLGSWAGATVECEGTIIGIYSSLVPECTDEFVKELGQHSFSSVQEFREQIKADVMEQKMTAKRQLVLDAFFEGVEVKKYPKEEVKAYQDRYLADIKAMADDLDMKFADYLSEYLQVTEDQINEFALQDARERVKNDMACIQACRLMEVELSDKEYKEGLKRYYEGEKENATDPEAYAKEFPSTKEFEEHYTKIFLEDCFRWDKLFEIMVENAVSTIEK